MLSLSKSQQSRNDQILSEQYAAQIASLSCIVSLNSIDQGSSNYVRYGYKKGKTKYQYNKERVRDIAFQRDRYPKPIEEVTDELESIGRISYNVFKTDPIPFLREYQYQEAKETLRKVQFNSNFAQNIDKIDINELLLGHNQFLLLCKGLRRSSVKSLIFSGNNLTNQSMKALSMILRSMHNLAELSVARNKITDEGISYLFHEDCYSSTLMKIDISCNILGPPSAYYIASLFHSTGNSVGSASKNQMSLKSLVLGGKVGRKGWGDEFIRVLVCGIITGSRLSKIKEIHIADAQLTKYGFHALAALLVCDKVGIEELNISRNASQDSRTRKNFLTAVRMNRTLTKLFIRECGFSEKEMQICRDAVERNHRLNHNYTNSAYQQHQQLLYEDSSSIISNSISLIENNNNSIQQKLEESSISSSKTSLLMNKPNSYSSSRNRYLTIHSEEGSSAYNKCFDNNPQEYYNKATPFSWLELSSLSACIAAAYNMCRHSYHKVKISFVLDHPWRIPKPPQWQPVSPPPSTEYSDGYDMLSVIVNKFNNALVMLPTILKQDMSMINTELKYVGLLEEANGLCAITTMDPRSIRTVKHSTDDASSMECINELYIALKSSKLALLCYTELCKDAKDHFLIELENFMINAEEQVRIVKRKDRRHISNIRIEVSSYLNNDAIMMSIEDYRAALVEKCSCFEKLIGALYMQKLLYFCLFEGQISKLNEVFNIPNSMRKSLPYYDNLGLSASFAHYFYIAFAKEKEDDHVQVAENMIRRITMRDSDPMTAIKTPTVATTTIPINYEGDQGISKKELEEKEEDDNTQEEVIVPYTKENRKKEKRAPVFLCKRTDLAGKTDASIKAELAAKAKALRKAMNAEVTIEKEDADNDSAINRNDENDSQSVSFLQIGFMNDSSIEELSQEAADEYDEASHTLLPSIIDPHANKTSSLQSNKQLETSHSNNSSVISLPKI